MESAATRFLQAIDQSLYRLRLTPINSCRALRYAALLPFYTDQRRIQSSSSNRYRVSYARRRRDELKNAICLSGDTCLVPLRLGRGDVAVTVNSLNFPASVRSYLNYELRTTLHITPPIIRIYREDSRGPGR